MSTDPVLSARSRVAVAHRGDSPDPAKITEAYRALNAAHAERAIRRALVAAPPISREQRRDLAALLTNGATR